MTVVNSLAPRGRSTAPPAPTQAMPPDPRETMRRLPRLLQYPTTLFTGKALPGQASLGWTPGFHLATATVSVALGTLISALAHTLGHVLLLPVGWAVTLHGMRNLRMMVYHQ